MSSNIYQIKYEPKPSKEVPVVSFANGKLLEYAKENIKFECFEHKNNSKSKKSKKIMVAESTRMQYVGYNFGEQSLRLNSLQSYYIGVLNKRTGKMNVFSSEFFQLKPFLEDSTQVTNVDALNSSYKDRNDLLVSAFGGKKKRKAMEARKRYSVHGDSLETSVNTSMGDAKILSNQVFQESSPEAIPPQNKNAKAPEEVYDIKTIISEAEYTELDSFISEFSEADKQKLEEWKKSGVHSEYVINFIPGLPKKTSIRNHKLKLLAYFDLIVKMIKLKYTDLRKKDPIPSISDPIKQCLLNKFTISTETAKSGSSRSMGPKMKDKAIAYALVIALILENFSIDLSQFQVDFKMSSTKLTVIVNALGCYTSKKVIKGNQTAVADLKLPLFSPSIKKFSAKK